MATAVVTGASSGIGKDMAICLAKQGYDLILCARREDRLKELASTLSVKTYIFKADLSKEEECKKLFEFSLDKNPEILINNAGFGLFGHFSGTSVESELSMIDLNVRGLHILTKLFTQYFIKQDKGYILNVASAAAFMPAGPLLSTYYSTKAYVYTLTNSVRYELKRQKSKVSISQLCPGPVKTEFSAVSGVDFMSAGRKSMDVAEYAIKKMFKKKGIIIPGILTKIGFVIVRFIPMKILLPLIYMFQKSKQ